MKRLVLAACAFVLTVSPATADVISDWNFRAGQLMTVPVALRRGPSAVLDLAMVHLAMHDAVQAYERRFAPYCASISAAAGSPVAAASSAARGVLIGLFPEKAAVITGDYEALNAGYISQGLMVAGDPGDLVGKEAADCILGLRLDDNRERNTADSFEGGFGAGEWRPTVPPVNGQAVRMAADFLARVAPFAMNAANQFRTEDPPPALWSDTYTKAYNEVKAKGVADPLKTTRTAAETQTARFFADAPANYWNRLQRDFVVSRSLNLGDSARMFALVAMATADAIIASWDTKIAYNFWRPITAIREGDTDGNPDTAGDPAWSSLFNAPNYPDYTSGANNVAAATTGILEHLFGDKVDFTLTSNVANTLPRTYSRFSHVTRDVIDARIFMGIHFRFADTAAFRQGRHVANWTYAHFLRPIGGNAK